MSFCNSKICQPQLSTPQTLSTDIIQNLYSLVNKKYRLMPKNIGSNVKRLSNYIPEPANNKFTHY
jgi:hypothetical protein